MHFFCVGNVINTMVQVDNHKGVSGRFNIFTSYLSVSSKVWILRNLYHCSWRWTYRL